MLIILWYGSLPDKIVDHADAHPDHDEDEEDQDDDHMRRGEVQRYGGALRAAVLLVPAPLAVPHVVTF